MVGACCISAMWLVQFQLVSTFVVCHPPRLVSRVPLYCLLSNQVFCPQTFRMKKGGMHTNVAKVLITVKHSRTLTATMQKKCFNKLLNQGNTKCTPPPPTEKSLKNCVKAWKPLKWVLMTACLTTTISSESALLALLQATLQQQHSLNKMEAKCNMMQSKKQKNRTIYQT